MRAATRPMPSKHDNISQMTVLRTRPRREPESSTDRLVPRLPAEIQRRASVCRPAVVVATTADHAPPRRNHDTLCGRRAPAPDTTLRIGQPLDTTPEYCLNLHRMYDPRPNRYRCTRPRHRPIRHDRLKAAVGARTRDTVADCCRKSSSSATFAGRLSCTRMPTTQWT